MRWFLAGLAFAAVVGLAVGTAAVEAESVRLRQRMQWRGELLDALEVGLLAKRLDFERLVELPNLVRYWLELQARLDREVAA